MDFFSILSLLGGLALFLYGMNSMGEGLKKLSGGKLKSILGRLTSNRFKGFFLGFAVTALIQSSSATTVMLVGFVNSGIMKLSQTISIIMGANIGTTVTAWLLSLSGISGDSFWVKIFKPSSFTPILAVVGVIMTMASNKDKNRDIGSILIGFSILMFGMETMSSSMDGLKDSTAFSHMLVMFANPVMGILMGTVLTAIIQSSSASVGILQALSLSGAINFSTALPIILGQNIGTTITPILSAINGNTDSKRVAISCLYIKLIGVIIISVIFYTLNMIMRFSFMDSTIGVVSIAVIHTLFNILSTVILMPFCNSIEKLADISIRSKKEEKKTDVFDTLDERFLSVPSFAVEKCHQLVCQMADISNSSIIKATELLRNFDKKKIKQINDSEDLVDTYEDKISTYLVRLAGSKLSDKDSREVTKLLHVIGDVERISDHAVNIMRGAEEINSKEIKFSEEAIREIHIISDAVCEILSLAVEALKNEDCEIAKKVEPLEQIIDKLKYKIKNNHVARLRDGNCTVEMGFILSDLLNNYERVSDHCSNIAVCLLEIANNSFETHEYLNHVKNDGENEFFELYAAYRKKYSI
ncbi:MAG: Na/Pi cotransporter family protein [Firmicutes bacterium]|nr:Na/Pi cotransporter family protein [Bacillota bacterium]